MKAKHKYTVFGFNIESELELPMLKVAEGMLEASIAFGKVPEHIEAFAEKTPWFELAPEKFLLRVDGIAKYYAENGKLIVIEPHEGATEDDIRVFLLDNVLAALLQQRGYLALHGAVAEINGKAVAFLGSSPSGKTTIALNLYDRGYKLLGDEVCAINIQNGKAKVFPGVPQLNAWEDTLVSAGKEVNCLQPVRQGLEKYAFSILEKYCEEPSELSAVVLLTGHNKETIQADAVKGGKKFERLVNNSFYYGTAADKKEQFKLLSTITSARFMQVAYSSRVCSPKELTDFILGELNL